MDFKTFDKLVSKGTREYNKIYDWCSDQGFKETNKRGSTVFKVDGVTIDLSLIDIDNDVVAVIKKRGHGKVEVSTFREFKRELKLLGIVG